MRAARVTAFFAVILGGYKEVPLSVLGAACVIA